MNKEELLAKKIKNKGKLKAVRMKKRAAKKPVKDANYYKNENIPFQKRYTRITTYIRIDLNNRIRQLKKLGKVKSITAFINAAIINQLKRY